MPSRVLAVCLLALSLTVASTAQTTDASCLPFYNWTSNSQKQSPCQVASTLIGVCTPSFNIASLPDGTHYLGPSSGFVTPCQCNTVVYSLMSACGACQGRTYEGWNEWTANCATVSIGSYPEALPPNVYVPAWAYLDVKSGDRFNETAARLAINGTEQSLPVSSSIRSMPTSAKTNLSTSSAQASTSQTVSKPAAATSATSNSSDPRLSTIVGGVVGGVLGLALIVTLVVWLVLRDRERRAARGNTLPSTPVIRTSDAPGPETANTMSQYLANTVPQPMAPSITTTSLPSPTSAKFSGSIATASTRSLGPSNA